MDNANQAEITKERFESFMFALKDFLAKAEEAKKRGYNDYNPLKAVQKFDNEVNMHSGFLHSLLDTNGEHYQDDLFLSLFLDTLRLKVWFGDTKNAQVLKEHKNIDIYITNGENHIIIENKIWADDQPKQIAQYIEAIHDENSNENVSYENIAVVYLSPFGKEPSQNSLDKWQINNDMLECGNDKILYKQISYEKEILEWIEKCQSKSGVGNITSLNSALEFYKDIVQIITGNKKENTMSIVDFLKQDKSLEYFDIACKIIQQAKNIKQEHLNVLTEYLKSEIKNNQGKYQGWKILLGKEECEEFRSSPDTQYWKNIVIYNEKYEESKQTFRFMFDGEKGGYFCVRLSIRKGDYINFVDESNVVGEKVAKLRNFLPENFSKIINNSGWWFKDWLYSKDLVSFGYFLDNYQKVNEINEWLKKQESTQGSDIAKLAEEIKSIK